MDVGVDASGRASRFLVRCLVGAALAKSLNGQLGRMVDHVWGTTSRRDTAALALDSSLLRRPALMHFRHELTSLLSERRRKASTSFHHRRETHLPSSSPACFEVRLRRRVRPRLAASGKSNLVLPGGSLRVIPTSRVQSKRKDVCTIRPPRMSRGKYTVARRGAGPWTRDMKSR